ncbi:DUF4399 domain-containing protein [Bradyrhizobium oligotrophicum]|uniref:DUF4399 domain-containing protein n=1 Tax=Bradyrhizobium oligotrophicum TaxID=44255 RepID=UPI003EBC2FE6
MTCRGLPVALISSLACLALAVSLTLAPYHARAQSRSAPKDAYVYFIYPTDGDTVKSLFWCRFGLRNMGVTHAGDNFSNTGHHHLLIDSNEQISPGEPIPQDRQHLHYGGGETEALIELPPGKHTLQLVMGDGMHFNFDPPLMSKKITITVEGGADRKNRSAAQSHHGKKHIRAARPAETSTAEAPLPDPAKSAGAVDFLKGLLSGTSDSGTKPPR